MLVRDFELLRVHMLARESMLVQVRIQLLSHLAVIGLFFWLGCVDSRNPYAPKSSRFPERKASRNALASRSFTPGSPWALGIVMTPRRKDSGSNLALGITIVEIRLIDWFIGCPSRPWTWSSELRIQV